MSNHNIEVHVRQNIGPCNSLKKMKIKIYCGVYVDYYVDYPPPPPNWLKSEAWQQ